MVDGTDFRIHDWKLSLIRNSDPFSKHTDWKWIKKKTNSTAIWFFIMLHYRPRHWNHIAFILLSEPCRGLCRLHICGAINVLHRRTGREQKTNKSTDPRPALLSVSNIVWPRELDLEKLAVHFWAKSVFIDSRAQIVIHFKSLRKRWKNNNKCSNIFKVVSSTVCVFYIVVIFYDTETQKTHFQLCFPLDLLGVIQLQANIKKIMLPFKELKELTLQFLVNTVQNRLIRVAWFTGSSSGWVTKRLHFQTITTLLTVTPGSFKCAVFKICIL